MTLLKEIRAAKCDYQKGNVTLRAFDDGSLAVSSATDHTTAYFRADELEDLQSLLSDFLGDSGCPVCADADGDF